MTHPGHLFRYVYLADAPPFGLEPPSVAFRVNQDANLDEVIEAVERYLRACGYSFDGHLEIVEDNQE